MACIVSISSSEAGHRQETLIAEHCEIITALQARDGRRAGRILRATPAVRASVRYRRARLSCRKEPAMKAPPFAYHDPRSRDDLIGLLAELGTPSFWRVVSRWFRC